MVVDISRASGIGEEDNPRVFNFFYVFTVKILRLFCGVSVIKVPAQSQYPQNVLDHDHRSLLKFGVRGGRLRGADINQDTQETERQSVELRLPFIHQCIPGRHDTLVVDISRASGIGEEDDPRVFFFFTCSP